MRYCGKQFTIFLAILVLSIVSSPASAANAPATGCNGAWTAEEYSGDCGPYDYFYKTPTETYQPIASPCPTLPQYCSYATREDFGNTVGWYNIYKNANYNGTGGLNPWWYRILERDHGGWFYEQCPYTWTTQCPQAATLNKQYFNIYLGPPEGGDLPTIPSADSAYKANGNLDPRQHYAMTCGADPSTGGPLSGATVVNITSGFNSGSCTQTTETLYGQATGTEGQASLSVSQGYSTTFEVSTESDSSFGWSVGVTVAVSEGGDISPVKSEQSISASVMGTVSSSSTKTNSTSVQYLNTQTVTFDVKDGYTCSVEFVVTSCRSTYSYKVPLLLSGSFRSAWWKCDNNGVSVADPYTDDPKPNQGYHYDESIVLDDYWTQELRQTSGVTFSGTLTSNVYGKYNASCYLTNPPPPLAVSVDGNCGAGPNETCMGSKAGNCCSAKGVCGSSSLACTQTFDSTGKATGCQTAYGSCTVIPSTTGACGGSTSMTCTGSGLGDCCSIYGNCGDGDFFCGTGCQAGFGLCGSVTTSSTSPAASSTTTSVRSTTTAVTVPATTTTKPSSSSKTSSTSAAPTSSGLAISTAGRCGSSAGQTCTGSLFGNCCSQYGYCGTSYANCGSGCRSAYGLCGVPIVQTKNGYCGVKSRTTCTGTKYGACCGNNGRCGNGSKFCGNGCFTRYGTCNPSS